MCMIIAISGKIGSGKNTLSEIIQEKYPNFICLAFGDYLKQCVATVTNVPFDELLTHKGKTKFIDEYNITTGEMCQKLSDAMKIYDADIFVKALKLRLEPNKKYIITDLRFKNELKMLNSMGAITIRINRPEDLNCENKKTKRNHQHISEIDLDDYTDWDHLIINDKGLKHLEEYVSYNI